MSKKLRIYYPLLWMMLLCVCLPLGAAAQQKTTVSGKVTGPTGEPIVGAVVMQKGTNIAVVTNQKGEFSLRMSVGEAEIEVSFLGMKPMTLKAVGGTQNMAVQMTEDLMQLDEVVVVGYGQMAKRDITGAITSISAKDMDNSAGGDINMALQGKIPGMSIVTNSGEPGAGSTISIRGAASINGSGEPLYIIDGVPFESGNVTSIDGDATFSPLADLNPADIESIEVLRDAASASIYGSRAANGVVIITTKGGNKLIETRPEITISHISSMVSVGRKLDVLDADQFRSAYIDAILNSSGNYPTIAWVVNPTHPYYLNTTDWQDVMFDRVHQFKTDLSLRGSSERMSYGISLGYKDTKPIVVGTSYNQYTARANFTYKINKSITGTTNASFSNTNYDRVISGTNNVGALRAAVYTNPCYTPTDPISGEVLYWLGNRDARNPLALALHVPINYKRQGIVLNQSIAAEITKGLVLKTSVSTNITIDQQESYTPRDFSSATSALRVDVHKFSKTFGQNVLNENTLSFNRTFAKKHRVSALLGQSLSFNRAEDYTLSGQDYMDEQVLPIQSAAQMTSVLQRTNEYAMLSFFGRVNYTFADRYIFAATIRRDGSSRFGSGRRFGNFPSVSLGWRFSDEPFLAFAKPVLYDGKLRASYGVTGNQSIGNYQWRGGYESNSLRYNGSVAVVQSSMANTDLGWETTEQYNLGLDLSLFDGRVSFSADAYLKTSEDLLFNFPLASYTGFSSVARNFGKIENKGLEFIITSVNVQKPLRWTTSFNISFNRNKIISLPEGSSILFGTFSLAEEGQPAGVFYAHRTLGVYARTEDNIWYGPNGEVRPVLRGSTDGAPFVGGDMIWKDVDGNGIIDDNDREVLGSPHPKFFGGFSSTLSYKGFMLSAQFQFSYGNKVMNEFDRERSSMRYAYNGGVDVLRRWRKEGDVTDFPRLVYSDLPQNFRASNYFMEDGSFLRLQNVTLRYRVPSEILRKVKFLHGAEVYVSGTNLLTWSTYTGYDPEVNTSTNAFIKGIDNGAFPKSRSINLGVDLKF